jgi:hypothetical protein
MIRRQAPPHTRACLVPDNLIPCTLSSSGNELSMFIESCSVVEATVQVTESSFMDIQMDRHYYLASDPKHIVRWILHTVYVISKFNHIRSSVLVSTTYSQCPSIMSLKMPPCKSIFIYSSFGNQPKIQDPIAENAIHTRSQFSLVLKNRLKM